jgi:hypothetical protein
VATWAEYQVREFAEVEVIYSSIVYLYDIAMVIACGKYIPQGDTFIGSDYLLHLMDENTVA